MLNLVVKKDKINIFLIIILTLIITGFCLKFLPAFPIPSDTEEYDGVALNLIQGRGLTLNNQPTQEPIGYPLFLAGIYYIFGYDWQVVRFIQYILLAGLGIIIYLITRKFLNFSPLLAFLSSLTLIFWPYFIVYPIFIGSEILFIFFLLLSVYFLLTFLKKSSFENSLISGIFFGITALIRPVAFILPFWLVFFLLIFWKLFKQKDYFLKFILTLIIFLAIFSPWVIRNYIYFDAFFPVYHPAMQKSFISLDFTQDSKPLKPGEADFKTLTLAKLKNIYLFWNPGAEGLNAQALQRKFPVIESVFILYKILFFATLALAFGSLKWIRKNKNIFLFWIIIFYTWALHTILWPYPRYTLPIIPLVIILAWFTLRNIAYKIGEKA